MTHAPEQQLLAHIEAHGSELFRLVPALRAGFRICRPSKATDSDTERFLLFAAVVGLLATVAQQQPVILVLDDLQWADKGSLLFLRHLASAAPDHACADRRRPTGTVISNADDLVDSGCPAPSRGHLPDRPGRPGRPRGGGLMEAGSGHPLDDGAIALAHAIYQETDGNPSLSARYSATWSKQVQSARTRQDTG